MSLEHKFEKNTTPELANNRRLRIRNHHLRDFLNKFIAGWMTCKIMDGSVDIECTCGEIMCGTDAGQIR
jgi:hypothetical protein